MGKRTTFFLDGPYEEFLKYEVQRTRHPVSAVIRNCILSSREYADYRKVLSKPSVEPKTTTTVVADTPAAEPVDVHGYLSRTARYREPTLQETMAELDRVSDAGTPIGQYRVSDVKPRPPCEHGVPSDSFCEACADLELAGERAEGHSSDSHNAADGERMGDGT